MIIDFTAEILRAYVLLKFIIFLHVFAGLEQLVLVSLQKVLDILLSFTGAADINGEGVHILILEFFSSVFAEVEGVGRGTVLLHA